jgi:hypothetical protein
MPTQQQARGDIGRVALSYPKSILPYPTARSRAAHHATPARQQQARGDVGRVAQLRAQRAPEEHAELRAPAARARAPLCVPPLWRVMHHA